MPFLSPLRLQDTGTGRFWVLLDALLYRSKADELFLVPRLFVTDLASSPRVAWVSVPPHGKYSRAAVLHDWFYREAIGTRADADRLFREAMEDDGVGAYTRWKLWIAVRIGGATRWGKKLDFEVDRIED
jgi:hypothetical protein